MPDTDGLSSLENIMTLEQVPWYHTITGNLD